MKIAAWVNVSIIICLFSAAQTLQARPEYAVTTGMSCVSCHSSPWGGGPKNVYGKFYGSHDYPLSQYSKQDWASGSIRGVSYYPTGNTPVGQTSSGTTLMEASASANLPIVDGEGQIETRLVATYNMAPLGPGARETYIRLKGTGDNPIYYLIGRFNSPFGLLTDEHRTYVRLQTNSTLNTFVTGGAISANPWSWLWVDLALVNDLQGSGIFSSNDITSGVVFNARVSPKELPLFMGLSQNYESSEVNPAPYATSLYGALSFERWTAGKIPATLLFEFVNAMNWNASWVNPQLGTFFVPSSDTTYATALSYTRSMGYYSQLKYNLNHHWNIFYKLDILIPNADFAGDQYTRHGIGFEYFINSNLILNARYEKALVSRPEVAGTAALAAEDDAIAMLRLWL